MTRSRAVRAAAWLWPLWVSACAPAHAVPWAGAPQEGPDSGVRVRFAPHADMGEMRLTVELAGDGWTRRVGPGELRTTERMPQPHSPWYSTPPRGTLRIRASVSAASGAPLGGGVVEVPLMAGRRYVVEVLPWRPGPASPAPPCLDCHSEGRFPLAPDPRAGTVPGDSLVVRAMAVPSRGEPPIT